jgi:small conductance mechanosensitive channel
MLFRRSKQSSLAAQRLRSMSAFESRTEQWRQVGLGSEIDRQQEQRARGGMIVFGGAIALVLILFSQRSTLFPGLGTPVRIATVAALVVLGWGLARTLGRGLAPPLYRRLEPGTAGILGFLIRLLTIAAMLVVALRIAGLDAGTLAAGGAFTAVILGLAAQQTLGNIFAGLVLLTTRPFRVGERIRITGGITAGSIEGIVSSLGLFYVTLISGADRTMIPNSSMLQLAVSPLREPERVELRARFDATTNPAEVQARLREGVTVPLRYPPDITLEELDRDEVVVQIAATPQSPADGAQLAGEILAAVREDGGEGDDRDRDGVGAPA